MRHDPPLIIALLLVAQALVSAADAGLPAPSAIQTAGSPGVSAPADHPQPGTVVTISAEGNQFKGSVKGAVSQGVSPRIVTSFLNGPGFRAGCAHGETLEIRVCGRALSCDGPR